MPGDAGPFVRLSGAPAPLLAVVLPAVALQPPRGGAVLCGLLLASGEPLRFAVERASYVKGAGIWLKLSVAISAIGLVIALVGRMRQPRKPTDVSKDA